MEAENEGMFVPLFGVIERFFFSHTWLCFRGFFVVVVCFSRVLFGFIFPS